MVKIERLPFGLTPATSGIVRDSVLRFTAQPFGMTPDDPRYVWDFGDQTPVVTVVGGDSVVTHKFTKNGTFTVKVVLHGIGKPLAVATATVTVSTPTVPTWRVTSWTPTTIAGNKSVESAIEFVPNAYYGADRFYYHSIGFNPSHGFIVSHPGGPVSGLGTQPASVWIMLRSDGQTTMTGAQKPRMFGRPPLPAGPGTPSPNDWLDITGPPTATQFRGGHSEDFEPKPGVKACARGEIVMTTSGNTISGSFRRYYRLTTCSIAPTAGSEFWFEYQFTAAKIQ
jgi:hypothetical protein